MTNSVSAAADCLMVAEYVNEAECPAHVASNQGEVVCPHVVANYLDVWGRDDGMREFTVLFKDGRVVVVRGHTLKHDLPRANVYSIAARIRGDEVIVALFKSDDVTGIFNGEVRPDRKIA